MPVNNTSKIGKVVVRMYKLGTGDCFTLKFYKGNRISFRMMIDCGCWKRSFDEIKPFVKELIKDMGGKLNVLVVTHEHLDHVLGFQAAKELFMKDLKIGEIWMGWPENDADPKVKEWKEKYGEKKLALAEAASVIQQFIAGPQLMSQFSGSRFTNELFGMHQHFGVAMQEFADLHVSGEIKDSLVGMKVVKEDLAENNIKYFSPGKIMENIQDLPGVRIYVLGPPELYAAVKKESGDSGDSGESYDHNKDIDLDDLLMHAVRNQQSSSQDEEILPFDSTYTITEPTELDATRKHYEKEPWRQIDFDWLFSAGSLALRMNSLTNNLSLAMAIEFIDSGKILLFPGDAEFGSWKTWHDINWKDQGVDVETKDLLARTVFYKVAHHLSHNGTAQSIGLDLMTDPRLTAMATLDYDIISAGWKSTMPNRLIVRDLLRKTQGRLMIMNTNNLFYDFENQIPMEDKIKEARSTLDAEAKKQLKTDLKDTSPHFIQYTVRI
ncbi:MAG: hypothetical protein IPL46_18855 [Saprospiraceae bacterium]|nr:hypothetical protein [Saprospiraceae bacterium]